MESIWKKSIKMPSFPKINEDKKTDVLIIGGGIAGILTAYLLKQKGADCILVEKGLICNGTTANTTAKITYQHGLMYHKLVKSSGTEASKGYLLANQMAFDKYAEMCKNIKCDYEVKDNYVYSVDDRLKLEQEFSALDKIGYPAELCEYVKLPFKTIGAVKFSKQAQFNPLKFLSVIAKDLNIYENTFVKEICETTAVTDYGKITADFVIVTTHFPFINKHGSFFLKLFQHRSYLLALKNAPDVEGMYVDECKTGLSFRNYNDYLLIGGGGHRTGKKGGGWTELSNFSHLFYPKAKEYCRWAAQDCMNLDNIPYIGQYSNRTRQLYTATGFNKWGMTGAMLSAILLSDMIQGEKTILPGCSVRQEIF